MSFSPILFQRFRTMGIALIVLISLILGQIALADTIQKHFSTPDEAVQELLKAVAEDNVDGLMTIFGEEGKSVIDSGDEQADREARRNFNEMAQKLMRLDDLGEDQREVVVGEDEWPFPIPLVKGESGWRFDTAVGVDELINRRIGRNELEAISMLKALADAQTQYGSVDHDDDQVLEYAQRLVSSPGQRDGLYWPDESEVDLSPIGPYLQDAGDYLEERTKGDPWYGYYFRVLTRQGANPPGGAYDYVINGNMIAGFALLAFPARYGDSGIVTFMISHQGVMYQKDLGEQTDETVKSINEYNPDDSWQPVTDP
ncbi:MAG: DUF2950 domain-containing protein [Candidatus Competibacteraceae bacterium]|jgi:hypothetical protein|nr:DUF2950 domain-containing protein [Candidatus Competibacteraceae bacterium]